jgi:hypothetical protein
MIVQEYQMIEGDGPTDLTIKVNELLSRGWKLHGSSSVTACDYGISFVQPVVREVEQPGAWG